MPSLRPQSIARGFSITLAARIAAAALGLLQLIVLAKVFGAAAATDVWHVVIQVAMLFLVFLTGPLHTSFMPVYAERREQVPEDAPRLVHALYTVLLPLLALGSVLVWLMAPQIVALVAPGFSGERLTLAVRLLRWLAPLPLLTGLAEFPAMLLLSHRRYTWPALGSLFYAFGVVVATYILGIRFGIVVAAQGGLAAILLEAVVLTLVLPTAIPRPRFTLHWQDAGVARVLALLWPRFVTIGGGRLNLFVDNMFASTLPAGMLAALNFGEKLTRIPVILFAGPVTRTVMPVMADWAAQGRTDRIADMLGRYLRLAIVLACAVGAVFVFFPSETVRVFYRRGAFDDTAVGLTSIALLCYGVGMISYAARLLISTAFFALQDTRTPMQWSLVGVAVNVLADWLFLKWFGHGGIALSTAVVETAVAIGLFYSLHRRLGGFDVRETVRTMVVSVGVAAVCGAGAWCAARLAEPALLPPGFWRDLLLVACTAGPAGLVYVYVLHRLGVREVEHVFGRILDMMRRPFGRNGEEERGDE